MTGNNRLDWAQARARLVQVQESMERTGMESEEKRARIFRRRAEFLARPVAQQESGESQQILIFRLDDAPYGIPLLNVAEVLNDAKIAIVPGAPPEVDGVVQVRGEVRPVYDLRHLLGLAKGRRPERETLLVMKRESTEFAALVDSVDDVRSVVQKERTPGGHTLWITDDLITVLDINSFWDSKQEEERLIQ